MFDSLGLVAIMFDCFAAENFNINLFGFILILIWIRLQPFKGYAIYQNQV